MSRADNLARIWRDREEGTKFPLDAPAKHYFENTHDIKFDAQTIGKQRCCLLVRVSAHVVMYESL